MSHTFYMYFRNSAVNSVATVHHSAEELKHPLHQNTARESRYTV